MTRRPLAPKPQSLEFIATSIEILNAIPESELNSSRAIHDSLLDTPQTRINPANIHIRFLDRAINLFNHLDKLANRARVEREIPIIHIDGHGSRDHLEFPVGPPAPWSTIFDKFRKINIATKNNLFVTSGACYSAWGIVPAIVNAPTPLFGLYAPTGPISAGEAQDGFIAFYRNLLTSTKVGDAISALKQCVGSQKFYLLLAHDLFERAAVKYIKEHCTGKGKQSRIEALVTQAAARGYSVRKSRRHIKRELGKPQAPSLQQQYNHFMMVDLSPKNKERFNFKMTDIESKIRSAVTRQS